MPLAGKDPDCCIQPCSLLEPDTPTMIMIKVLDKKMLPMSPAGNDDLNSVHTSIQ